MKKQVALIVLDGWGYREEKKDNAIAQANKPIFDSIWNTYPHTTLKASGVAVGLPEGQIGNSEVGHMTIGAGKIIDQDLVRINKAITVGEFQRSPALALLFRHVKENDSVLHVAGLVSPGGVHSHMSHLYAFLESARDFGITKIAIHAITDGRDTAPQNGTNYLKELENFIEKIGVGKIVTVSGRLYAMDRDQRWERLAKTEAVIFEKQGLFCNTNPSSFLKSLYEKYNSDEYIEPFVCSTNTEDYTLKKNDGFFVFNFRPDRVRMLTQKIIERTKNENVYVLTMTNYGDEFHCPFVFPPVKVETTLGKIISDNGLTQAHVAETEKFAHATYFLNCGEEKPYPGEKQIIVPSKRNGLTYNLMPEMSAKEVADVAIEQINDGVDFIFVNFANADMVGHTADVPALIKGIEVVDHELGRILEALTARNGIACITADHGNAEMNIDPETKEKHTAHTTSLVPFIVTDSKGKLSEGSLIDVAPTVLCLLGLPTPKEMTGKNLLQA